MSSQQDGGKSESLSIAETNKLRAKIGLKPLEVQDTSGGDAAKSKQEDVHAPAKNLLDQKQAVKIREKVERTRNMRKMHQKLSSVKGLGEPEEDDGDTQNWINESRAKADEKRKAEKKQRELDAMDEDFGVSAMMEDEVRRGAGRHGRGRTANTDYSSSDLRGLTVEHDQDAFIDGADTILTLKDQDVLEDGDDVLVNVNLMDLEKAKKNRDNKKRKPDYRPWEEDELDEDGMPKEKKILSKYDEEITGTQPKKSFLLEAGGTADLSDRMVMETIKKDMQARAQTLDYSRGELAREYYTTEEMTTFKKPKKKRKVKKKMLKADDLLKMDPVDEPSSADLGRHSSSSKQQGSAPARIKQEPRDDVAGTRLSEDEEDDSELRIALARTRRLRQMERRQPSPDPADVQVKMEVEVESDQEEDEESRGVVFGGAVSMSTTSEFCRTVGTERTSPTHRSAALPSQSDDEDDNDNGDDMDIDDEDAPAAGWNQIDPKQRKKEKIDIKLEVEDNVILEEEPIVSSSLAACLQMADQKGFLEQQKSKAELRQKGVSLQLVGSAAEADAKTRDKLGARREQERRDRDRDRDRDRYDRDRERNPLDKAGYKPNVKFEYVDDSGRLLDQKGAFRQLSWRFHGKTSGKAKTEKRKKQQEGEAKLLKMSSTDTPLATRALLEDKLKETKSPFLILSGSAQRSLTANTITKP